MPAAANAWAAQWTVLEPVTLPLGSVGTAWTSTATGGTFGMVVPKGANTVTVGLNATNGSATLVYQVDKSTGQVTVTPQDLTSATTLGNVTKALGVVGTKVKAYGIPQADGTLKAYVLFYYTGTAPAQ